MIVSFEHNFVFIKTKKTGGTSVEIALSPHAGATGIITPLQGPDEVVRYKVCPEGLPRNYTDNAEEEEEYREAIRESSLNGGKPPGRRKVKAKFNFFNHIPASRARNRLPEEFWNKAFKFTVERHPYEKAVSMAYYRRKGRERIDMGRLLDSVIEGGDYNNYRRYAIDGVVAADFIIHFERMADDLKEVEKRFGLEILKYLPDAKGGFRADRRPARDILSDTQKARIREHCAEEFKLFHYEE